MPALSPTMETGILAEWYLAEGARFAAGEAVAKIETDKASIDFEAQDDGFIGESWHSSCAVNIVSFSFAMNRNAERWTRDSSHARSIAGRNLIVPLSLLLRGPRASTAKILFEGGTGADIPVGTPIMVTVEEEDDVAAFADFVLDVAAAPAAAPAVQPTPAPPAPAPVAAAAPPPAPVAAPAPAPIPVVAAVAAEPVPPPRMEAMIEAVAPVLSTGWGDFAKLNSPILKTLSKQQTSYVEKYGTTGQVPL